MGEEKESKKKEKRGYKHQGKTERLPGLEAGTFEADHPSSLK